MNSSRDDCRKRMAFAGQLFLGCTFLLLQADFSPARADSWQQRAPVPGARAAHSAVWTGREMIVWGGGIDGQFLNTGARYTPSTDTWRTTTPYGAPSPRWFHAAVWTGEEMIIWGGRPNFYGNDNLNDGARYNPTTDTWAPVSSYGAPTPRSQCAAVWTGEELIIWGGATDGGVPLSDGAAYNPVTDEWRPINNASGLAPRMEPTAVWTGSEMIIFGGVDATQPGGLSFGDGARYDPFTDLWTPLPAGGAPGSRTGHTAVWTGERMIVWGGRALPSYSLLNDGAIYHPGADTWAPIPFSYDVPQARMLHAAVWTGTEMIVWGGQADEAGTLLNTGARYNPATGIWTPTTQDNAPGKRMFWRPDLGIWTGRGMLVCAGSDYPASLDSTALYTVFDPPCPPVIREQPQSVTVIVGNPLTLAVGAGDCATAAHPTATQTSFGPYAQNFEFETGTHAGQLQFDYDFFNIPDSLRVYYDGERIFDNSLSGQGTIRVSFGPGSARSVNIVINEEGAPASTAWEYTVSYRPSPLHYQWRKNGAALEGETNATLHFASVSLADAGDYSVVVANNSSAVVSTVATLTVRPPPLTNCIPGLVAWWRGDGDATDATGAHDGQLLFGTLFSTGVVGQAFTFDLSRARVSIPDDDAFKLTDSLSFEGWINVASYAPGIIFIRGDNRGGLDPYFMSMQPSGQLHWGFSTADNDSAVVESPGALPTGVWVHVAAVLDGAAGNMGLYVNGTLANQINTSLRPLGDLDPNWEPALGIGNHGGTFHHFPFHGSVDEWALYSRALSAAEIQGIYNAGAAGKCVTNATPSTCVPAVADLVGWWAAENNANDLVGTNRGILLGGTRFAAGAVNQAFLFTTPSNGVKIAASPELDVGAGAGMTVELWINPDDVTQRGPLVEWNNGLDLWGAHFWILPNQSGAGLQPPSAATAGPGQLYAAFTLLGQWYQMATDANVLEPHVFQHVALTYDKTTGVGRIYRNGVMVAEQTLGAFTPQTSYDLYLGLRPSGPPGDPREAYHGLMDEVSLYRRALSHAEILSIYQAGAAGKCFGTNPPQPALVFDVSRDFSPSSNPTGPWSYGYSATLGGQFNLLLFRKTFGANNGVPISAWQVSDAFGPSVNRVMGDGIAVSEGGAFTAPSGTVYVWPGNDGSPGAFGVIRFTVPAGGSGVYRIASDVRPTFDGPVSGDTDFHVLKNGQELFGEFLAPNFGTSYSNTLALATGDTIDFAVGRGADGSPDHSSLKVHATVSGRAQALMGIENISFLAAGGLHVTGHAPHGAICRVERSTNLLDWEPAGSAVEAANGVFEFIDSQPPAGPACFYRFRGSEP